MADFGKLNFSTSFNPTSAFPLDARCYFESFAEAQAAAAKAKEVGSTEAVYHYGMKLLVNQDGVYTWYQISTNNTLISDGAGASPLPREVSSEAEMNAILYNATESSIGTIYKYVGETTSTYEYGALYILSEEILDGNGVTY